MSDDDGITRDERSSGFLMAEHRLAILITASIIVALVFAAIGLTLYNTSGTAQLDLSRPGFEGVDKLVNDHKTDSVDYPATGPINEEALTKFDRMYKKQLENVTSVDAFSGDPLAPDALGINELPPEDTHE